MSLAVSIGRKGTMQNCYPLGKSTSRDTRQNPGHFPGGKLRNTDQFIKMGTSLGEGGSGQSSGTRWTLIDIRVRKATRKS